MGVRGEMGMEKAPAQLAPCRVLYEDDWERVRLSTALLACDTDQLYTLHVIRNFTVQQ